MDSGPDGIDQEHGRHPGEPSLKLPELCAERPWAHLRPHRYHGYVASRYSLGWHFPSSLGYTALRFKIAKTVLDPFPPCDMNSQLVPKFHTTHLHCPAPPLPFDFAFNPNSTFRCFEQKLDRSWQELESKD